AFAADRGDLGKIGRLDSERVDKAVGEIVRQVQRVGIDAVAGRFDELDLAGGGHSASPLVVFHLPGDQLVAAVVDLHRSAGDHLLGIVVVDEFVGGEDQLRVIGYGGRELLDIRALGEGRAPSGERQRANSHACKQG